jgi:hypothetical protein
MFDKCFADLTTTVGGRKITKEEANLLRGEFTREYLEQAKSGAAYSESVINAANAVKNRKVTDAKVKEYRQYQQANAMQYVMDFIDKNHGKFASKNQTLQRLLYDFTDQAGGVQSVESAAMALRSDAGRKLSKIFEVIGTDKTGTFENRENAEAFIRAVFDEKADVAPEFKQAAKDAKELFEAFRQRRNAAGGLTEKLKNWFPQNWAQHSVLNAWQHHPDAKTLTRKQRYAASREQIVNDYFPRIDRTMHNYFAKDGTPFTDDQLKDFLRKSFSTIATNGATKENKQGTAGALANRQRAERQIHIKSVDDWLFLNSRYGEGTISGALDRHFHMMAKEIKLMEVFGPDPIKTFDFFINRNNKAADAANDWAGVKREEADAARARHALEWSMSLDGVVPQHGFIRFMKAVGNVMRFKLGGAAISSFTDNATMRMAAMAFKGNQLQMTLNQAKRLNPFDNGQRELLQQLGMLSDYHIQAMMRDVTDLKANGWSAFASNVVMRGSLLPKMTATRRETARLMMNSAMGFMTKNYNHYLDISKADRVILDGYGVDNDTFQVWKQSKLIDTDYGNSMLDAQNIYDIPQAKLEAILPHKFEALELELAQQRANIQKRIDEAKSHEDLVKSQKALDIINEQAPDRVRNLADTIRRDAVESYLGVVASESHNAVIEPSWRTKSLMRLGTRRDTAGGVMVDAIMQFKQFPMAVMLQLMPRAKAFEGVERVKYLGALAASMMMMGAFVVQLQQLMAGRDPRDMNDRRFWIAAALRSGGLGPFGDLAFANESLSGRGAVDYVAGPTISTAAKALEIAFTPLRAQTTADAKINYANMGAKIANEVRSTVPGALWWFTRKPIDQFVMYPLQESLSPGYLRRIENKTRQEFGQRHYWRPNEKLPSRAPDLSKAWED